MSGFMGIGGGLVMVPLLVILSKFTQHMAQGTSLAVLTLPVVVFGAYQYYQEGNINMNAAITIAIFFCIGIFLGSKTAHLLSSENLKIISLNWKRNVTPTEPIQIWSHQTKRG